MRITHRFDQMVSGWDQEPFPAKNRSGVAMIMVMVAIAIGTTVVADSRYQAQVQSRMALNSIEQTKGAFLAKSGINLARMVLELETLLFTMAPNLKGQNIQLYRYMDLITGVFNTAALNLPIGQIDLGGIAGLGHIEGAFRVTLEPEDSRYNLNAMDDLGTRNDSVREMLMMFSPESYRPMFERRDSDGDVMDARYVISNIIDWVDKDHERTVIGDDGFIRLGGSGDENALYQSDTRPYKIKNAKFDSVDELRMVKGVDDLFLDTFGQEFTVYKGNRVNVNTASTMRLRALLCSHLTNPNDPICSPLQPEAILPYLQVVVNEKSIKELLMQTPFKTPQEFVATLDKATLPPFNLPPLALDKPGLTKAIAVNSTVYRIRGEGQVGNLITTIETVVDAGKNGQILYWRVH